MNERVDSKIVKKFVNGCESSFCLIYNKYKDKIYFYCFRYCKSEEDTQELVQIIFIKLWENRHKIDYKRPLEPYLFTIVRNQIYDFLKSLSFYELIKRNSDQDEIPSSNLLDLIQFNEYQDLANQAIDKLPEMRQIIFKMKYEEGLETEEIASLLKLSPNTVKSQLAKASKSIREYLSMYMHIFPVLICLV